MPATLRWCEEYGTNILSTKYCPNGDPAGPPAVTGGGGQPPNSIVDGIPLFRVTKIALQNPTKLPMIHSRLLDPPVFQTVLIPTDPVPTNPTLPGPALPSAPPTSKRLPLSACLLVGSIFNELFADRPSDPVLGTQPGG